MVPPFQAHKGYGQETKNLSNRLAEQTGLENPFHFGGWAIIARCAL
jgi:hypothetical protein